MKATLLFLLILLFSFWSCEKGDDEIIVHHERPRLLISVRNGGVVSPNSPAVISYQTIGEADSVLFNTQKVTELNGNYLTGTLTCDTTIIASVYGPGGEDSVTIVIRVVKPEPIFDATINSLSIGYGETVRITWKTSDLKSLTLNNLPVPFTGSKDIVLMNDSTFVLRGITIDDEVKTKTFAVEVGAKPNWRTFLETGLNVIWKLSQVYYMPEGSTDWVLSNANTNDFQIIFMSDGTVQSYWTGMPWGYHGMWSLSGNNLNFEGDAQIQNINNTELVLYYEKRPRIINGEHIEMPHKFIYKRN